MRMPRVVLNNGYQIALTLGLSLLLTACGDPWPPKSPASEALEDFGGPLESEEIDYIYESAEAHAAADGSSEGSTHWGFVHRQGEFTLGFNPFDVPSALPGYYESQVEVVYFDESMAQLRLDPEAGDKMLLVRDMFRTAPSVLVTGARLRVGKTVYELREDGWYVDDEIVHEFGEQ